MSSLAVLEAPSGRLLVTLQLLCDGVPLRGQIHVDGTAEGRTNFVRFEVPHLRGGRSARVANGGVDDHALLRMEWAGLTHRLYHGMSLTVHADRDKSRGMFRLGVWPCPKARGTSLGEEIFHSKWRLVDTKLGLGELPLQVKTPTGDTILAASDTASLDWLKESVERELGIPRAQQRLRAPDGSCPANMFDRHGRPFQSLLVCGKERCGKNLWFHVEHQQGNEFLEALSSDSVGSVLERVRSLVGDSGMLYGLYQDRTELRVDWKLADCNVACLDTLELRERGTLRLAVAVEFAEFADASLPTAVEVGVDPDDSVAELRRRAVLKAVADPAKRGRLARDGGAMALRLWDQELEGHRSVAECGLASLRTGRLVLCLIPSWMVIHVKMLTGKTVHVPCTAADSVETLKLRISDLEGIPVDLQRLIYAGRQLEDLWTLSHYNVTAGATVHLALRLGGGRGGNFPWESYSPWLQFDFYVQ